jgi:hypothetical protein
MWRIKRKGLPGTAAQKEEGLDRNLKVRDLTSNTCSVTSQWCYQEEVTYEVSNLSLSLSTLLYKMGMITCTSGCRSSPLPEVARSEIQAA